MKIVKNTFSSPTVRLISGLAGSNLFSMIIGVIGSLVQARFVMPVDLGYFRGFSIASGYAFFFHFGFLDVLQRFYPYYIGRDEKERALAVAEVCQAWIIAISLLVSGTFLVLGGTSLAQGNWRAALGWIVQAIAMAGFIYGGYLGATYRSGHDFATLAKGSVISSTVNLFTLPFFVFWPYVTMAVRSGLGSLVNLVYLHLHRPLHIPWRFNRREWLGLLKHGGPLFVASYGANTLWGVLEMSLILRFLGTQALGYWSMSFMILEMANKVPQAMTAVYVPRVTETYGRTRSVREALKLCKKPLVWGSASMLAMALLAYATFPFIIPVLMPKYVGAIPTMSLMMIILVFIILELPYTILVATGKLVQQNIAVYTGVGCFVLCALFAIKFGLGLNGVVASSLIGRGIKIIITYIFIFFNESVDTPRANPGVATL